MKGLRLFAALVAAVVVAACGEKNAAQNIAGPTAGSAVKFFNFGVNAPAVNFYADTQKISAISTGVCNNGIDGKTTDTLCLTTGKPSTNGTGYGANGSTTGLYYSVAPGSYTLSGRITATTDSGVAISNTPATLENGKFYSYYLSGIYNTSTKTVEGFVVEDPLPTIDLTATYVRFVNASSNSQPMTLHLKNSTGADTTVGTAVAYKGASAFVRVDPGSYDLSTYVGGSNTAVITRTGVAFNAGHVYTVTAYGDMTVSTGTNIPKLDNTANW
ncbi:MAG TPA: DUF4397 domain-containing protein [Gemmatimonadaceae bacterium]|jgi:hypothetical protein